MGQTLNIREVWDHTIEALLESPARIEGFLYPDDAWDDPDSDVEGDKDEVDAISEDIGVPEEFGSSWRAIHFVLTGTEREGDFPWAFLVHGGDEIGDQEVGGRLVRAFKADAVSAIADALDSISRSEFELRAKRADLQVHNIYPKMWDRADSTSYLVEEFDKLKNVLRQAAKRGKGLIVYYS